MPLIKKLANTSVVKSISISYPPLDSENGVAFLSQNRQFQWTNTGNVIYPIIPAHAATLLKSKGLKVFWDDAIAEKLTYNQWLKRLLKNKPDLIVIESKTPVIKKHWQIINELKNKSLKIKNWKLKIVLMGDHVTALPKESIKNSKVDFILIGGNYDFLLDELITLINQNKKPKSKIFKLQQHHDLNSLPIIDRKLTRWQLYAYNNTNYKYKPGSYIMSGRDCWWGKCSFCITGDTRITTKEKIDTIENIVNNKIPCKVLTAEYGYQKITDWHKRFINENIKNISTLYLPNILKITSNHKVYYLSKNSLIRCNNKNSWSYKCKPSMVSKFLKCDSCLKKYYKNYTIDSIEAGKLKAGDFLAIPIDYKIKDVKQFNIENIISEQPTIFTTTRKINDEKVKKIIKLWNLKKSERTISKLLEIDRETVHRYLSLNKKGELLESINHLSYTDNKISFFNGHHKISKTIEINDDFLFIAGLFIAEGHVSFHKDRPNSATIGFTFNIKETDLIDKTKQFFANYFNLKLRETINKINHSCQISVSSTIVAKLFKILFGDNCYQKKIPPKLLYLPIEKQRYLLRGIFKGDGHLRPENKKRSGKEYILETTSLTLANQIFNMLLRFNVLPSYKTISPRLENESIKYKITLFRQDILKVFPDIKFLNNPKSTYKRGFILNNFAFVPIVKITEENFNGYVYNLTVNKDHSYVANFLAVKNCSWTTLFPGKCFRQFSVEHTLKEIENLVYNFGVKEVFDDSGTLPVGSWLKELCQALINSGLNKKVKIGCNMRFGAISLAEYQLMYKAGFRFILYGLESANQKTLDFINKNEKISDALKTLKIAKKTKLEPHVTIIIGYPNETKIDAEKTLNLARKIFKENLADSLQATILIPYPGTPLFKYCQDKNLLLTKNWDDFDMRQPVIKSPISPTDQIQLVQNLFKGIINPKFIFQKIISIKSINDIKHLSNYAIKYIKKLKDFS